MPSEQREELLRSIYMKGLNKTGKRKWNVAMRQSDKEELLYGNTGRKRLLTLKKTQEIFENFSKIFKLFLGSRKGVMGTDINLKVDSKIISNQETVVEIFADHFETVNIYYLPAGRSVWWKTVTEFLKILWPRAAFQDRGHSFSPYGLTLSW